MGAVGDETVTRKKALIIAISEYDKANHLEDLPFCRNDGDEMINVLKSQGYEILDNHKLVGYVKYDVMWNVVARNSPLTYVLDRLRQILTIRVGMAFLITKLNDLPIVNPVQQEVW